MNLFIEITKSQADVLVASSGLIPGCFYKISGVDVSLYNDGSNSGTLVVLQALTENSFCKKGHGVFHNPRYESFSVWHNTVAAYPNTIVGVFRPNEAVVADNGATGVLFCTISDGLFLPSGGDWSLAHSVIGSDSGATANISFLSRQDYSVGDKVAWGGYIWENVNGNVGKATSLFELNNEWAKKLYSEEWYKKVIDEIVYDFDSDKIIERFESKNNNLVSTDVNRAASKPIAAFMWGSNSGIINNNRVVKSFFETINFTGETITGCVVESNSEFSNNRFYGSAALDRVTLTKQSQITLCSFNNGGMSFVEIDSTSSIENCSFGQSTFINCVKFANGSSLSQVSFFRSNCGMFNCVLLNTVIQKTAFDSMGESTGFYLCHLQGVVFGQDFASVLTGKGMRKVSAIAGVVSEDISSSTVLCADYMKTLYNRPDGNSMLSYLDNMNALQVVAINT